MKDEVRHFFTEQEIEELDLEELAKIAGGGGGNNEVKCPKCKQKYPIREIKDHMKQCKRDK